MPSSRTLRILVGFIFASALQARGGVVTTGGISLMQEGGSGHPFTANLAAGKVAFAKDEIGAPPHAIAKVNDGLFGNGNSWIAGSQNSFVGINLGVLTAVRAVAFGRDVAGGFTERTLGLYELQYTTVANPSASTPDASWTSIGTLDYQSAGGANFANPSLRHVFNLPSTVMATGIRLRVNATTVFDLTCVDELELYSQAFYPNVALVAQGETFRPNNLAVTGAAFSKDELGGIHTTAKLKDGVYGNSNSWIAGTLDSYSGMSLGSALSTLTSVAFGRDNLGGFTDRWQGVYTLQVTTVPNPTASTPDASWTTVGILDYTNMEQTGNFTLPARRHEWSLPSVQATGFRIKTQAASQAVCLDEIELYGVPEPLYYASLISLATSRGTLNPVFTSSTMAYTLPAVTYNVSSLTVTPTAAVPQASITVNGVAVTSGVPSGSVPLSTGSNTVTVVTTAPDGMTTRAYTITVYRFTAAEGDPALSSITTDAGALSPAFNSSITSYALPDTPSTTTSITVTPVSAQSATTIKVNEVAVTSGNPITVQLRQGENSINIATTAFDGVTTRSYTLSVYRQVVTQAGKALFRFGPASGDVALPRGDDNFVDVTMLGIGPAGSSLSLSYWGRSYTHFAVNNNGNICFVRPISNNTATGFNSATFPVLNLTPMIAPFWADVDTRHSSSGRVWYRVAQDSSTLSTIATTVANSFPSHRGFTPTFAQIVTWDQVGYYSQKVDKLNTFQLVVASHGVESYVLFYYPQNGINWLLGDLNTPTQLPSVGYDAGDGVNYHNMPGSRTNLVADLPAMSNTIPASAGLQIYRMDTSMFTVPPAGSPLNFPTSTSISGSRAWAQGAAGWSGVSTWSNGNSAVFPGAAGTVTLTDPIVARRLTLDTSGYTFTSASAAHSLQIGGLVMPSAGTTATFAGSLVVLTNDDYGAGYVDPVLGLQRGSTLSLGDLTFTDSSVLVARFAGMVNGARLRLKKHAQMQLYTADATTRSSPVTFDNTEGGIGGTFDLRGLSTTIGLISSSGLGAGLITNSSATAATLTVDFDTESRTYSGIVQNGTGPLTLIKTGTGTLSLIGPRSYSGDTTVSAGTFSLSSSGFADSADIALASGATLDLNFTGTDTVDELYINGVRQARGTWGSLTSTAVHKSSQMTGSGILNVNTGESATVVAFALWANSLGLTGPNTGFDADYDHDGLLNLLEFALGTLPNNAALGPLSFSGNVITTGQPVADGTNAVFIRRKDHIAAGLVYTVEFSPDLITWTASTATPTVLADDGTHEVVSVPMPALQTRHFFRVKLNTVP
ncbi:MAG: cadherin-like beta sandwich domain-containing protein [Verrucomicrobia bacterium]|nr:cadherin-like beta sandwich domain-containing protein [Verrucomicrobiota bacterium]